MIVRFKILKNTKILKIHNLNIAYVQNMLCRNMKPERQKLLIQFTDQEKNS